MRMKRIALLLGLAFGVASCRSIPDPPGDGGASWAHQGPGIAAGVNGERISWEEVASRLPDLRPGPGEAELRRAVLFERVEERLVQQSAAKNHLEVTESEIDEIQERRRKEGAALGPGDGKGCVGTGSIAQLREDLRKDLLYRKVFRHFADEGSLTDEPITEAGIRIFFEEHQQEFEGELAQNRSRVRRFLELGKWEADRTRLVEYLYRGARILPPEL